MSDFVVSLRLDADGKAVVTETRRSRREVERFGDSSKRAGKDARGFGDNVRRSGRDVERGTRHVGGLTQGLGALRRAAALVGTIGITISVGSALRTLADFSQEISTVGAVSQASRGELALLREESRRLGATTRFSATEAAQGMAFLARAGFDTATILRETSNALNLAQAGALDLASAADIASNVLQAFRLETDQFARVADVLALAASRSNTNIQQLGEAMKQAAPVAASAGIELEETAAIIGALSNAGLQASLAGTGLRGIIASLESPSQIARDEIESLGLTVDDVRPSAVGLTTALQRLGDAGLDVGQGFRVFGREAGPAAEVIAQAIPDIRGLGTELLAAAGTAERLAREMDDNLNGAVLGLRSRFQELQLAVGAAGAEGSLRDLIETATRGLEVLAANADTINTVIAAAAAMGTAYVGARIAVGAFSVLAAAKLLPSLGTMRDLLFAGSRVMRRDFVPAAVLSTSAVQALNVAIRANPLGLLVTGLTLAAGAFVVFRDRASDAKDETTAYIEETRRLREEKEALAETTERSATAALQEAIANQQQVLARREQIRLELELARGEADRQRRRSTRRGTDRRQAAEAEVARLDGLLRDASDSVDRTTDDVDVAIRALDDLKRSFGEAAEGGKDLVNTREDLVEFAKGFEQLEQSLDPAAKSAALFSNAAQTITAQLALGNITLERASDLFERLANEIYPTAAAFMAQVNDQMREEARLLQLTERERQAELVVRQRVQEAQAAGIELSDREVAQLRRWALAQADAAEQMGRRKEVERRAAEEITDIWREARRDVQRLMADEIFGALEGELNSVKDIASSYVKIWKRAFAEVAAATIFQNLAQPGQGGLGDLLGLAGLQQSGPGNSEIPTVSLDDSTGLGKALSSFRSTLDDFGANFGFAGAGAQSPDFVGPPKPGQEIGTTLSQGLGQGLQLLGQGAAAFSIGQQIGDLIGLGETGGNMLGGAAAGFVVGGPIGAGIGAALAGIGSALKGKDRPQAFVALSGTGAGSVRTGDGGDAGVATQLRNSVQGALSAIVAEAGGQLSPRSFGDIGVRRDSLFFIPDTATNGRRDARTTAGTAEEVVLAAIREALRTGVVTGLSDVAEQILRRSSATTPDALLQDLSFAGTFEQLSRAGRETSRFSAELQELGETFLDAIKQARDFGLDVDQLGAGFNRARDRIRGEFERDTDLAILDFTNPIRAALERQQDEQRQFLLDAAAVGADLDQARRRVRLERDALVEELTAGMSRATALFQRDISNILNELRFGERSGLAAQERLPLLQQQFLRLADAAATDEDARRQLDGATRELLDVAGDVLASSAQFFAIQGQVASRLEQLAIDGLVMPDVQSIADEVGRIEMDPEFARLMSQIGDEIASSNGEVVDLLTEIRDSLRPQPGIPGIAGIPNIPGWPNIDIDRLRQVLP